MPTQTYELFIRAAPQQVWDAITRPEHTERYFFGTRVAFENGRIEYTAGPQLVVDGEVLKRENGRELVTTWRIHYAPACASEISRVTWRVEPRGEATKLTAIHELDGAPNTAESVGTNGWSVVLSGLKTLLETGTPLVVGQPG
ncbi:SRPBCC domain-containing protein [Sandaracinus amylolyticus]|uniref:SRPBCC domain-containing protein n=1 Tax=Sandaracinus amylolyticus TaxID=927083 RepID=UPI001F40FEDC|nr:SRPBCC domain-containing protein [Sandaracinus amylolyticus]UJR82370.1 Hypothetical protein I5071_44350 [Sandaracinus amylolyticus]